MARKLIDYPVLKNDNFTIERIQKFNFLGLHINNMSLGITQAKHLCEMKFYEPQFRSKKIF